MVLKIKITNLSTEQQAICEMNIVLRQNRVMESRSLHAAQ